MKRLLFLFLLIGFHRVSMAQQAYNINASAAQFICESQSSVFTSFSDQTDCLYLRHPQVKLYFYYRAASNHIAPPSFTLFTLSASSGAVDCSVNVWGPYNDKDAAVSGYSGDTPLVTYAQTSSPIAVSHNLSNGKTYLMEVTVYSCTAAFSLTSSNPGWFSNSWKADECIGCITGFRPMVGNYILSAWVKDAGAELGTVSYSQPSIVITSNSVVTSCNPTGEIIDGWQRIEQEIYLGDEDPQIDLVCGEGGDCFFDDIRIFPYDGSMVTYVYDPITLRLMAELDERNYAKIYEYDEQGKLIRVKKETEMGVMTIQENRENNSKE